MMTFIRSFSRSGGARALFILACLFLGGCYDRRDPAKPTTSYARIAAPSPAARA